MGATIWTYPVEGPCVGHRCDNCRICLKGHCCRKDDPDYKLPALGDWDGPIHGELGVLENVGGKVVCHACGEDHGFLAPHIWHRHDLTVAEYRAIFGLARTCALAGDRFREAASASAWKRYRTTDFAEKGRVAQEQTTPEQQDAQRRRPLRLQTRKRLSEARGGKKTNVCAVCGRSFTGYWVMRRQTCGAASCTSAVLSRATSGKAKSAAHRQHLSETRKRLFAQGLLGPDGRRIVPQAQSPHP